MTGEADPDELAAAVACARGADAAIVCVGGLSGVTRAATSGELRDAAHLELPAGQRRLIADVAATGTPTVVVVLSGRAHALTGEAAVAGALLFAWLPGEEGGSAIADVLTRHPPTGLASSERAGPGCVVGGVGKGVGRGRLTDCRRRLGRRPAARSRRPGFGGRARPSRQAVE